MFTTHSDVEDVTPCFTCIFWICLFSLEYWQFPIRKEYKYFEMKYFTK